MTSKDASKSILRDKKVEGKFIGSKSSFGYMRDPHEDKYNGIISVDSYARLSSNTENLIRTYNSRIKELENYINEVPKKYNDEETNRKIKELISMKKILENYHSTSR